MFKNIAKSKRLLMWTLFLIFMLQMPHFALSAGIDTIHKNVFADQSLSVIQTVFSLPNLLSVAGGILASVLISGGFMTKKNLTVVGISIVAVTGVVALLFHTQFWQLVLFSVLVGLGIGLFIPTSQSIMIDSFDESERRIISGLQFSFINLGGILMSIAGGFLITLIWYGGYIMLLVMLPVAVLAIFALPQDKIRMSRHRDEAGKQRRSKLPVAVFYYSAILFLFTMMFSVTMSNLPTHLESNHLGNAGTAGVAIAVTMAGGVFSGIFFDKLSSKLHDFMIPTAFILMFVGYTLLNVLSGSLILVFISVFIVGMSSSLCLPQCIFSTSQCVDPTNSALAATFLSCVAPGSGGFLSPVIFTNVTQAIVPDDTGFRYQFVGIVALVLGVLYLFNSLRRNRVKAIVPEPAE